MYGNGVKMYMMKKPIANINVAILYIRLVARSGFLGAGPGSGLPGTAARRTATGARPATGTGTSVSGLCSPRSADKAGRQAGEGNAGCGVGAERNGAETEQPALPSGGIAKGEAPLLEAKIL